MLFQLSDRIWKICKRAQLNCEFGSIKTFYNRKLVLQKSRLHWHLKCVIRERVGSNKDKLTSSLSKNLIFLVHTKMQGRCFQIHPVQSGGQNREKYLWTLCVYIQCLSHTLKTKSPLIECRENQGNEQYISNDVTLLFLIQSDDLLNTISRLMTDREEEEMRAKEKKPGGVKRERERREPICAFTCFSQTYHHAN